MGADRRDRPPVPAWLGRPLEPFYRAVVARRNRAFDAGRRVTRMPIPVLSVGNLSVGGTGKTPMVMRLIELLRAGGRRPMVAMRGYRARPGQHSDEQAEYLARFPDLPIVAQPDRTAGVLAFLRADPNAADCIILDDGFQHRFVTRDVDIVLVDATRPPTADRCLPSGWLREPVSALARAHVVVLTHAESAGDAELNELEGHLRRIKPSLTIVRASHAWTGLLTDAQHLPVEWLSGRRTIVACGVGNPGPIFARARAAGAVVVHEHAFPDHHHWTRADLRRLAAQHPAADALLVSGKDWVKLAPLVRSAELPWRIVRPVLSLRFESGETALFSRVLEAVAVPRPPV